MVEFFADLPRATLVAGVLVFAAVALGLRERVSELLSKEDYWMLDLRQAYAQELHAEPEREDGKERGFTPPRGLDLQTSPQICGCPTPRS